RAVDWYVNGLDFISLFTMPGPDGAPALVHLRRWRYQDILLCKGAAPVGGEWTISVMATAEQLPAIAARARAHGGGTGEGPADTPWNTRDLRLTGPDGYTGEQDLTSARAGDHLAAEGQAGAAGQRCRCRTA